MERKSVLPENPDVAGRLREKLDRWLKKVPAKMLER